MMNSSAVCITIILAVSATLSYGIKMFDRGDCGLTPEAMEVVVKCAEPYENNLPEMTDAKFNKLKPKEQEQAKKDLGSVLKCTLITIGAMDETEFLNKDAVIDYYKDSYVLDPPCRKDILVKKITDCLKNYKKKEQNNSAGLCIGIGQQSICDKGYKSPDPKCKF